MKAGSPGNHRDADPGRLQAAMPADAQGKANGMAIAQNRPGTMQASVGLVETLAPFAFVLPRSILTSMANRLIRYLTYLAYLVSAGAFWLGIAVYGFGFIPAPHTRECDITRMPCPKSSILEISLGTGFTLSILPLTVLGFIILRRWLHRMQGLDDQEL